MARRCRGLNEPLQPQEWELILALHRTKRIEKVYPILLGKPQPDGTRTE